MQISTFCLSRAFKSTRLKKMFLVMKLTVLIFFIGLLHVSASSLGQRISLSENNVSMSKLFREIKKQSGYSFLYDAGVIDAFPNVNVEITDANIETVLKELFKNKPLEYLIIDKAVVVHLKDEPRVVTGKPDPQVFYGKVTDEEGLRLPGVTIKMMDKTGKVIGQWTTNQNGEFTLMATDPEHKLLFSYIGFTTYEVLVKNLKNPLNIVLKGTASALDQVQVIAYGTSSKRTNVGDVTVIDAKTIQQYPTTNVLDALQGTVPGMAVYKNTGNPNSTYKVQIRGINGSNTSGQPLYIVDGIPYRFQSSTWLTRNGNLGAQGINGSGGQGYDALGAINPDDIESISVLKDADATAIYGARAADGVIIITTKKGKAGSLKADASVYTGVSTPSRQASLLNLSQYLQMRREAYKNENLAIPTINTPLNNTAYDINGAWDTTRSTNWQKELIGGARHNTKAQIGLSGGSDNVQFRVSGGYNYIGNVAILGGNDWTGNVSTSLTATSNNKKFTAQISAGYLYDYSTLPQADLTGNVNMAPDAPALYTANGALNFQNNTFSNPLVIKNYINNAANTNLTSSLTLSYKIINDLEVKLTTGYNKQSMNEFLGAPTSINLPFGTQFASSSTFTYNNASAWSIEPQVNYNKRFGKGKLSAMVGASLQDAYNNAMSLTATGYSSDLLLSSLTAGSAIAKSTGYSEADTRFSGLFARINYNWADKYYVDITGRNDGSSLFGSNNQYHLFAAVGAGWIFSEEGFVKEHLPFISFGKLRGSYGSTGRANTISPYQYLSTFSSNSITVAGVSGLTPNGLANPDLHWETTKKAELGLEIQFLKGRIAFETNFYRNRTTDLLGSSQYSVVTGFGSIPANIPALVQNQGFDMSLTTNNIRGKDFSWSTTFLFTRDRNKLLDYPNLATSTNASIYTIGQPVNIRRFYPFGGVNPQTGMYQVIKADGSMAGPLTPLTQADKTALVNINPDFFGSVQNNITYKQFRLNFLFRYIKQVGRNVFYSFGAIPPGTVNTNYSDIVLNRWQKPGDITNVQRFGVNNIQLLLAQNNAAQSDWGYGDASYIRLQNLSLSYSLTQKMARKLGMETLQVYVQGDNLWTITRYNGIDPETQNLSTLPTLRIVTAGLRLTL